MKLVGLADLGECVVVVIQITAVVVSGVSERWYFTLLVQLDWTSM